MENSSEKIMVLAKCNKCGRTVKLYVCPEDLDRYNEGELVQNAFPYLSAGDRELLISGICPKCWDNMFSM